MFEDTVKKTDWEWEIFKVCAVLILIPIFIICLVGCWYALFELTKVVFF